MLCVCVGVHDIAVVVVHRSTTSLLKRVELVESSVYKSLSVDVKQKMIRQPHAGLVSIAHQYLACVDR